MIGLMLFENAKNVNWSLIKEALPVFLMTIFIPFTYSIFNGVIYGYSIYIILFITTDYNIFIKKLQLFYNKIKLKFNNIINRNNNNYNNVNSFESFSSDFNRNIIINSHENNNNERKYNENSKEIYNLNENFHEISNELLMEEEIHNLTFELNDITVNNSDNNDNKEESIIFSNEITFDDVNFLNKSLISFVDTNDHYINMDMDMDNGKSNKL